MKKIYQRALGLSPYLKNNLNAKRAGYVVQVAEFLLNKHRALSSNPTLNQKKERKQGNKKIISVKVCVFSSLV